MLARCFSEKALRCRAFCYAISCGDGSRIARFAPDKSKFEVGLDIVADLWYDGGNKEEGVRLL
jgi:hypothetical protein